MEYSQLLFCSSTIHHVLVLCSVLFLSPGSCFGCYHTSPRPLLPLTLMPRPWTPWSQLHLLLNVPFWVLLLMLTRPLDIFSWNPGWTHHLELGHVRGWWTDYLHDLGSAIYPRPFPVAGGEPLGRRVEKRSCVSDMAKADPSADDPSFLVFNVDNSGFWLNNIAPVFSSPYGIVGTPWWLFHFAWKCSHSVVQTWTNCEVLSVFNELQVWRRDKTYVRHSHTELKGWCLECLSLLQKPWSYSFILGLSSTLDPRNLEKIRRALG